MTNSVQFTNGTLCTRKNKFICPGYGGKLARKVAIMAKSTITTSTTTSTSTSLTSTHLKRPEGLRQTLKNATLHSFGTSKYNTALSYARFYLPTAKLDTEGKPDKSFVIYFPRDTWFSGLYGQAWDIDYIECCNRWCFVSPEVDAKEAFATLSELIPQFEVEADAED